jgi:hypothetical protein
VTEPLWTGQLTEIETEVRDRTVPVVVMLGQAVARNQMPTKPIAEKPLQIERRITASRVLQIRCYLLVVEASAWIATESVTESEIEIVVVIWTLISLLEAAVRSR